MTDETKIINGSFKGVPLAITGGGREGGRKVSINQFPNRDTQNVEDLGLLPPKFTLEIIVSDKTGQDYFAYRDSLLQVLESAGPGVLIHPLYGRIEGIAAVSYSLNERFDSFGDSTITVNFETTDNVGIPETSGNVVTEVVEKNEAVKTAAAANIENNFKVTESFTGNFQAGKDKVSGFIDRAKNSVSFVGDIRDKVDNYAAQVGELSAEVNSLVTDPLGLATELDAFMDTVNGLHASYESTLETMRGFFGFGDDDEQPALVTATNIERVKNNDTINAFTAATSLGNAYVAASRINYQTTQDIDNVTAQLDEQYNAVVAGPADQATKDAVTDLRIVTLQALDEARVNAKQIVTVDTLPTSTRLLSFAYHGDDTESELIRELNGLSDVSFIEGELQVVTE